MTTIRGNGPRIAPLTTGNVQSTSGVTPSTVQSASTGYTSASSFNAGGGGGGAPVSALPAPPQSIASASTASGSYDLTQNNAEVRAGAEALLKRGDADSKELAGLLKKVFLTPDESKRMDELMQKVDIAEGSPEEKALSIRNTLESVIKSVLKGAEESMKKLSEKPKAWGEK
ncbi:MAG: hypothetical protein MUC96_25505 [Myxococcaceae bacterium]|jgi:hypothetical protein|nr:hypothetical protein [Myxococcaceae bacterium]